MRKFFIHLIFFSVTYTLSAQGTVSNKTHKHTNELFHISAGLANSCIDLSRYTGSGYINSYRGLHVGLLTHFSEIIQLSTEYSTFPVHSIPTKYDDIHTHKYDANLHFSFYTPANNSFYFLLGVNRHEWNAVYSGADEPLQNLFHGNNVEVKSWGMNTGIGFFAPINDDFSYYSDFRFCISNANRGSSSYIRDAMLTFGISFLIPPLPYREKTKSLALPGNEKQVPAHQSERKTFRVGKKIYKWTEKGGK